MESDKSVYAMVAIFALAFFIVMGIIVAYIFNIIVSQEKENVKNSMANSLFVALGRAVEKTFFGQELKFVAERFVRAETLPQNEEEPPNNGEIKEPSNPIGNKVSFCGDGIKDETEECDDGNNITEVCGYGESCRFCNSSCGIINVQGTYCGDGKLNGNEQCDDENLISGDGCNSLCRNETVNANHCYDSDISAAYSDGKNIFVRGYVNWTKTNGEHGVFYDECASSNNTREFYCINQEARNESINCPSSFECSGGKCIEIAQTPPITFFSSNLPDRAIDARIPYQSGNLSSIYGWDSITFTFSGDARGLSAGNFSLTGVGSAVSPRISSISQGANQNEIVLNFDKQISPGNRAIITYIPENKKICLGYLPGDVNGDGTFAPSDLLDFIDALNGAKSFPIYSTDIDRSGALSPADQLTFTDLMNGNYGNWIGKSLPPCVCSSDNQCGSGYACQSGECVQVSGSPNFSFLTKLRIWLFGK